MKTTERLHISFRLLCTFIFLLFSAIDNPRSPALRDPTPPRGFARGKLFEGGILSQ